MQFLVASLNRDLSGDAGRYRGVINEQCATPQGGKRAVGAEHDIGQIIVIANARDHNIGAFGGFCRAGRAAHGDARVCRQPRFGAGRSAVVDCQPVPGVAKVTGHGPAHDAKPQERDVGGGSGERSLICHGTNHIRFEQPCQPPCIAVQTIAWRREMTHWTKLFSRLAMLAFWPALLFALVMAVLPKPPELPTDNLGDKFQHMLAFFTLTVLAGCGWPRFPVVRLALWLSLVGVGIEVVQSIPVLHRTADWLDWLADSLAIVAGLVPVFALRHLNRRTGSA